MVYLNHLKQSLLVFDLNIINEGTFSGFLLLFFCEGGEVSDGTAEKINLKMEKL